LPVALFMHAYPDDRIIILPNFYITISLIIVGFLLRERLYILRKHSEGPFWTNIQKILSISITVIITFTTLLLVRQLILDVPSLKDYASRWDAREQYILQEKLNGSSELVIPGLEARELVADIRVDPNYWVNNCMAAYYGVDKIIGK